MASVFSDLEKILLNEQKKYEDRVAIGGIESLIANWVARVKANGDAESARGADQVLGAMQGYTSADRAQREQMIARAIGILRQHAPEQARSEKQKAKSAREARPRPAEQKQKQMRAPEPRVEEMSPTTA